MDFCPEHFNALANSEVGEWKGRDAGSWAKATGYTPDFNNNVILQGRLARTDLYGMCCNPKIRTLDLCAFIFAWGGMRVDNGKRILEETQWITVAEDLRSGAVSHYEAYARFYELAKAKMMGGCGPAYYTKLLLFLPHDGARGIIMDQWTGRSINLLMGRSIVRLLPVYDKAKSYRVAPDNDLTVYKEFCEIVQTLSERLNLPIQETEMMLFSEGRRKGAWRN